METEQDSHQMEVGEGRLALKVLKSRGNIKVGVIWVNHDVATMQTIKQTVVALLFAVVSFSGT